MIRKKRNDERGGHAEQPQEDSGASLSGSLVRKFSFSVAVLPAP